MNNPREGMTLIVKTVTRLTVGLILLYGIYIVTHGQITGGGGFPGGVIIALAFINLILAFGRRATLKKMNLLTSFSWDCLGTLVFLAIALLGLLGGFFFLNIFPRGYPFNLFSAGAIPFSNIAICLNVGGGLVAIFMVLIFFKSDSGGEK